jgi:hypothetical protein
MDPEFRLQYNYFTGKSDAERLSAQSGGGMRKGMVLVEVNGIDLRNKPYADARAALKLRPCAMVWADATSDGGAGTAVDGAGAGAVEVEGAGEEVGAAGGAAAAAEQTCVLVMEAGGLGLCISESVDSQYRVQFGYFTGSSNAEHVVQPVGGLQPRMVLTHVNTVDQMGVGYKEVRAALKVRPIALQFKLSEANATSEIKAGVSRKAAQLNQKPGRVLMLTTVPHLPPARRSPLSLPAPPLPSPPLPSPPHPWRREVPFR